MNVGGSEKKKEEKAPIAYSDKRPSVMYGKTHKLVANLSHVPENTYITVNEDEHGKPAEVFVHNSNSHSSLDFLDFLTHNGVSLEIAQMINGKMSQLSRESVAVTTRLTSLCLRHRVPVESVIKQLRKISSSDIYSLHKKMAMILSEYVKPGVVIDQCDNVVNGKRCGGQLMFQEGCLLCQECGQSKCG